MAASRMVVPLVVLMSALASAQSQVVSDLFNRADVVALVKIVSGDTENYEHSVYKRRSDPEFQGNASRSGSLFRPVCWRETRVGICSVSP